MQTPDLIKNLTGELKPFSEAPSPSAFMAPWLFGATLVFGFSLFVLPIRADLSSRISDPHFIAESCLWLASALCGAIIVYRASIPGLLDRKVQALGVFLLSALTLAVLFRINTPGASGLAQEFQGELSFKRGLCGPIILATGAVATLLLAYRTRKAAPTRLSLTSMWMHVAAGCFSSFGVQFICAHENPVHLLLWHFIPVVMLALAGTLAGKLLLKW